MILTAAPPWVLSDLPSPPCCQHVFCLKMFSIPSRQFLLSVFLLVWDHPVPHGRPTGDILLKKPGPPSRRSHQLSIALQLGVSPWTLPPLNASMFTVLTSCRQSELLRVLEYCSPIMFSRPCFSLVLTYFWLLKSFCFLFHHGPYAIRVKKTQLLWE